MPLQILRQDITKVKVDAIVNTTNQQMIGLSGVDLLVHTLAGKELDKECSKLVPLGLGMAKLTNGYNLPCKYIIHTSGPIWQDGLQGEHIILRSCYIESLKLAVQNGLTSIAFPLISSGTYGFPKDQVLKFATQTITEFLYDHELMVYLCVYDKQSYSFSQALYSDIKQFIDDEYVDEHSACLIDSASLCDEFEPDAFDEEPVAMNPYTSSKAMARSESLDEYLKHLDRSFQQMLFDLIDESGMTDVECYKRANVDRRTFSKIKSNKFYKPSKQTAIAFAISLQLDLETTQELLATVGYTLSRSHVFDKIIRYFIHNENYNIFEINEALFEFDQPLLGL